MKPELQIELEAILNRYSAENGSDTPDFILARYLYDCMRTFDSAVHSREVWYGRRSNPLAIAVEATGGQNETT